VIVIVLLALSACSTDATTTTTSPAPAAIETTVPTTAVSTTAIPSTVAPTTPSTTTTPSTATTTTVAATSTTVDVYYSVATHGLHPFPPLPDSGGWFGSGCSPGSDTLPDGIWWGYITDLSPTSITFDLACLTWIDDPNDDGLEEGGWDIENNNSKTRIVPVHPHAQAICLLWGCPPTPFPYTEWMEIAPVLPGSGSGMPDAGVWLYINDGEVTEVGEEVLAG
jgi:hypothetical protein